MDTMTKDYKNLRIYENTHEALESLAKRHKRTIVGMIDWLVDQQQKKDARDDRRKAKGESDDN